MKILLCNVHGVSNIETADESNFEQPCNREKIQTDTCCSSFLFSNVICRMNALPYLLCWFLCLLRIVFFPFLSFWIFVFGSCCIVSYQHHHCCILNSKKRKRKILHNELLIRHNFGFCFKKYIVKLFHFFSFFLLQTTEPNWQNSFRIRVSFIKIVLLFVIQNHLKRTRKEEFPRFTSIAYITLNVFIYPTNTK